jgi:molybdate transport system substrate-binding protein
MKKSMVILFSLLMVAALAVGCAEPAKQPEGENPVTLTIAAAASLEKSFVNDLIPAFQAKYDHITVQGTYDSSGKLQTQIEQGLNADIFFSAATKQMNALKDQDLIKADSIVNLLENKVVLIVPVAGDASVTSFETIVNAKTIAIGDPASVPAGQYAKEALTSLELWDGVESKLSLGTNVTEVLNWVAEGSAEVGIVYATDAAGNDKVKVVATAPEGSIATPVLYPIGMVAASEHQTEAQLLIDFLKSDEAKVIFERYGFHIAQ